MVPFQNFDLFWNEYLSYAASILIKQCIICANYGDTQEYNSPVGYDIKLIWQTYMVWNRCNKQNSIFYWLKSAG